MHIDIITLHPQMFGPLEQSIIGRAHEQSLVNINIVNLRDYGIGRYKQVDDTPYGGGAGMLLRVDVISNAVTSMRKPNSHVILMDPSGQPFNQHCAQHLCELSHLILICGHYGGVDSRVRDHLVDATMSIGDYVLTGGELAAMVVTDAVVRLINGVLGNRESLSNESFTRPLLEAPMYTRPSEFQGHRVPEVLLSGHHQKIEAHRRASAIETTRQLRPDLLKGSTIKPS